MRCVQSARRDGHSAAVPRTEPWSRRAPVLCRRLVVELELVRSRFAARSRSAAKALKESRAQPVGEGTPAEAADARSPLSFGASMSAGDRSGSAAALGALPRRLHRLAVELATFAPYRRLLQAARGRAPLCDGVAVGGLTGDLEAAEAPWPAMRLCEPGGPSTTHLRSAARTNARALAPTAGNGRRA